MAGKKRTENAAVTTEQEAPLLVPEFTIRADSDFGIRCMVAALGLSAILPTADQVAIADKMREFELYEANSRA